MVATVSSSEFTIATRQGSTDTVVVTSSTTFSRPGVTALSSLKKGSSVAVYGKFTSASTIAASRVTSGLGGPGQGRFGGRGAFGAIVSIGFGSFTITSFNGATETIQVSSFTSYEDSSGTISGLSALKKGQDVIVRGVVSGSVVKATDIRVVVPGTGGGFGGGGFGGGFGGGVAPNSGGSTGL